MKLVCSWHGHGPLNLHKTNNLRVYLLIRWLIISYSHFPGLFLPILFYSCIIFLIKLEHCFSTETITKQIIKTFFFNMNNCTMKLKHFFCSNGIFTNSQHIFYWDKHVFSWGIFFINGKMWLTYLITKTNKSVFPIYLTHAVLVITIFLPNEWSCFLEFNVWLVLQLVVEYHLGSWTLKIRI